MLRVIPSFLMFMLISFVGASVAAGQSNEELIQLAKPVLEAIMAGSWAYAAALALVLSVALVRRFGAKKWPSLDSAVAGSILVLVGGFGAAMATSLSAGASVSLPLVKAALKVSLFASGGYSILKPIVAWLESKAPAWASPAFALLALVFGDNAKKIEKAEAAGKAAVEAKPAKGSDQNFTDFPPKA